MTIAIALAGALALQAAWAPVAQAGTWTSKQCDIGSAAGAPDAFSFNTAGNSAELSNGCAGANFSERELLVNTPFASASANFGEYAGWGFAAPSGTVISDACVDAKLSASGSDPDWWPALYYQTGGALSVFGSGNHVSWETFCTGSGQSAEFLAGSLNCIHATCLPATGRLEMEEMNIQLQDSTAPGNPTASGPFVDDAWVRGAPNLDVSGTDQGGGVAGFLMFANNQVQLASFADVCDEQYVPGTAKKTLRLTPCGSSATHTFWNLNTSQAPFHEGSNSVFICSIDFATANSNGNCGTELTVMVDNIAPPEPDNFTLAGGSAWRSANDFDVSWTNPADSGSPLAGSVYELLDQQGQIVEGPTFVAGQTTSLSDIDVPGPGEYTLRARTRDAAGNESPNATTTLRFDPTAPGASQPNVANGWISRGEFPYLQKWQVVQNPPASGVMGYAVAIDRSANTDPCDPVGTGDPNCSDSEITFPGIGNTSTTIDDLPEGSNYVHVVAVSGANVPSGTIKHTELKVDKTDPNVELEGVPATPTTNDPVTLTAGATDALSGMQSLPGSDDGQPRTVIEVNGQVYEDDDDDVSVTLEGDGTYTVRYWARDLAGNETPGGSAAQTATFTIDRAAPDLDVLFKAKRRVKAGRKTKFTGYVHVTTAVLPPLGKLIEVQAKVGKRWKTVGEAFRTDPQGSFKMKYRFRKFYTEPTKFKFRLKVVPEAGWPYSQPIYSPKRKVKVIPRKR